MAVRPYGDYDTSIREETEETTAGGSAGMVFLWVAWAAAAIFWGFVLSTGVGILNAGDNPALAQPAGGADAGGVSWLLIDVVGAVLLLAALAWGASYWAGRDKRLDPMTEAATRAEYDLIEAHGGDEEITRSPSARRPEERDAYRAINRDMN